MLFDTHAHYDEDRFSRDLDEVLSSLKASGVGLVVDPGCDLKSSKKAISIAEKYDFVYAAAGIHPHEAKGASGGYLDKLREMCANPRVVAVGEIGLDYHYDFSPRSVQKRVFYEQLELARELKMPAVIHEREAAADCMDIVKSFRDVKGVFHCYSGSWETAKQILDMGWYISFTGVVTFANARRAVEVVSKMPADRLMIETDSPYMAPVPVRGTRNDSRNLGYIADRIALIRGVTPKTIEDLTTENGMRFFGIKSK